MKYKVRDYAFTTHKMPQFMKNLAESYIVKYYNKYVFPVDNNIVDIRTLNNLTNLDCMNCHLAHNKLCCEGPPYPPLPEEIKKVEIKFKEIFENTLNENEYKKKIKLLKQEKGLLNEERTFISDCGKCIFFNSLDGSGSFGCSIHQYALSNEIPYMDLKPSSCLMYPLDVLSLENGGYFIFGADKETVVNIFSEEIDGELSYNVTEGNKGFSRWNQNDLIPLCVNSDAKKRMNNKFEKNPLYKEYIPKNIFLDENYHPLYEEEKNVIINLFGLNVYQFIKEKSKELTLCK